MSEMCGDWFPWVFERVEKAFERNGYELPGPEDDDDEPEEEIPLLKAA